MNIVIIGAGICGLVLAQTLQEFTRNTEHTLTLLDKGRGVGGRMATRRYYPKDSHTKNPDTFIRWDHGAQYFTAQAEPFQSLCEKWAELGWIKPWNAISTAGHPRWISTEGMTQLCKHLAEPLDCILDQRVETLNKVKNRWQIMTDKGLSIDADIIVLTAPAPQCLDLFTQSGIHLAKNDENCLKSIEYQPCIALLGITESSCTNLSNGAIKTDSHSSIAWIANNTAKGISPAVPAALTVHTHPDWASSYWKNDDSQLISLLISDLEPWIKPHQWIHCELKRWRYSQVSQPANVHYLKPEGYNNLYIAGDGFVSGKIEGAVTSAFATARALLNTLASAG